jgi:DhnA family fructose-bisphosphate aldolase class Ia
MPAMSGFSSEAFLPRRILDRVTDLRVNEPDRVVAAAGRRKRRARLTEDGRLSIIAADHPARRVTAAAGDPLAMADRRDYLARVVRVLLGGAADGVMATMDLLEDLLLLGELVREAGGPAFLDNKLLIGSFNRGGLAGTSWELDDPMTGADTDGVRKLGFDGGKMLVRICDDDPGSLRTLVACSQAVTRLAEAGLPSFLEPLPARREGGSLKVVKEAEALTKAACVAAGLGNTSRHTWLKLPYCPGYERVAGATTLPILLLGGESVGDARPLLGQIVDGLRAGATVRGALAGRNVLYPGDKDPLSVARAIHGIIHLDHGVEEAMRTLEDQTGGELNALTRWFE